MTKPERIKLLIAKMKESLEVEAKYYNIRKKLVKICKTLNPHDIDEIWDNGLMEVTASWEQKKDDAYEMSKDGTRKMWQKRTYAQKHWLKVNTKGYVVQGAPSKGGNNNAVGHNGGGTAKNDTGCEHESVSRNTIVFHKPIDEDQWQSALMSLYAEAVRDLSYTPDELDALIATARRSVVR